ncbi:tetratricopeptide repeat protein [Fulvivirga sp. RKSG066]|uniref:DUF6340 family protein n=1 Tax=Fulvivirga aurantia TaxID=2529383 RepID=UPI0012BC5647|nr:DUF6340 family protein [Fulvivirga aurantia]MTI20465.1 tetratricopeptide repeat protein [Fulvivirga aurantia]
MKYSLVILAIFCTSIVGCLSSTSYRKTVSPELYTPENFQNIGIVSAFDTSLLTFNQKKKVHVFSQGSQNILVELAQEFKKQSDLEVLVADQLIRGAAEVSCSSETYKPTAVGTVTDNSYDFTIVLEAYDLYFDQEVEVQKDDDGSKTRTAYYDLIARACIALYDSNGHEINKVTVTEKHINYDKRSVLSGLLAVGPSMGNADKEVKRLSKDIAKEYVAKYHPQEVMITKNIYRQKELKGGVRALVFGNWSEAITFFSRYTNDPDSKIAGKAAYNLSVAYEALGMMDDATYWYEQAQKMLDGKKLPDEIFYD